METRIIMPEDSWALSGQRLPGEGCRLQRARFYLLCALLALLAAAGGLLFGATSYWRPKLDGLKNMLPANVDMRLGRLTLNEAGENGQTLVIEATTALYNQTEDTFLLEDVRARVGRGPEVYDITAAAGRYEQAQRIITLTGRVKVAESGGGLLLSERLVMNFEAGLISGESPFCYADPESDLEGSAFVYSLRDRSLTVEGPVRLLF
jgi:LPS export ABC transporter protein LptC